MNDFTNIGFNITDQLSGEKAVDYILSNGSAIETKHGLYVVVKDTSGAEIWAYMNAATCQSLVPYYHSISTRTVSLVKQVQSLEFPSAGGFVCWANPDDINDPESGETNFFFHAINFSDCIPKELNSFWNISLTAFAQELDYFDSEESFGVKLSDDSDIGIAPKAFIPDGLFSSDDAATEPYASFSGEILLVSKKINSITKKHYYWFLIDTYGGEIDVVADPELLDCEPEVGGYIYGHFWLVGRLLEQIYELPDMEKTVTVLDSADFDIQELLEGLGL